MTANLVVTQIRENVSFITINRPDNFNALDVETVQALRQAIEECFDEEIRAVVIQGSGRAFCAGGDLAFMQAQPTLSEGLGKILDIFNRVITDIRLLPKPVIAAVNGMAAGGGMSLALACDLRIVSERAKFKQAYTSGGLVPDAGWSSWAPVMLGLSKANELLYLDEIIDAQSAKSLGIANIVVSAEKFEQTVEAEALKLAKGPTLAYAQAKALLNQSILPNLESQLEKERQAMIKIGRSDDAIEGIKSFLEKRPPIFTGK
jgi:2-(1,2-epoxy-1,2-dihydrophenyl)acetyl-CoA isomerase